MIIENVRPFVRHIFGIRSNLVCVCTVFCSERAMVIQRARVYKRAFRLYGESISRYFDGQTYVCYEFTTYTERLRIAF